MKLGEIDKNRNPIKPNLFLCKPDKKTIAKISEAYDISYSTKLGTVNEISFKIPTVLEKDRIPIDNPNINNIKHRYLFKLTHGTTTEYFLMNERSKVYSDNEHVEYKAFSKAFELNDKLVRRLELKGMTLPQMLDGDGEQRMGVLNYTEWKTGYVDSFFVTTNEGGLRSHEISSQTVLEAVYELAEKFNAVLKWDTVKNEINIYKPENVGINKGLRISDGKYLESFNLSSNSEETITRLIPIGSEDLSIRRISATGSNYIEDFGYYMYPFERDGLGNVIQHSDHMSDELCVAILNYQSYLLSIDGQFKTFTGQLTTIQKTISEEEEILKGLQNELKLILDELDLSNAKFQMTEDGNEIPILDTPEHQAIIARRVAKEGQIDDKVAQIAQLVLLEASKQNQINVLVAASKIEVHLGNLMLELNKFIIEKEYINDTITDDEDLLKEGVEAFNQFREPKIRLDVDVLNFLTIVECQNDWDSLVLGDDISVRYGRLDVDIKAKIIEINYDFESDDISLVIANEKEVDNEIMDMIYDSSKTSSTVNMDKWKWDLSEENNGSINAIINSKWDSIKNAIVGGYDQLIEINERGITVKSLEDPSSWLVVQNGFLAITNDRGNSWKHAITKDGIVGERIYGKIIMGVNLAIEDESGILKFRGSRGQIFDRNGNEVMKLGLVSDEGVSRECFGITSWNSVNKVALTDCEGISISRKKLDDSWEKIFWVRATDGTLFTRDMVAERIKIVSDIGEVILDAESGYFDIGWFEKIVADGKLTTTEKYELWNVINNIMSQYQIILDHAGDFKFSTRDDKFNFDAQNPESSKKSSSTVIVDVTQLKLKYASLIAFMKQYISIPPLFDDEIMERTDEIDRNTFVVRFKEYYDEAEKVKNAIDNHLLYSGIQFGKFYNNLIMDARVGFMAIRSDYKYRARLSATEGLALEKWEKGAWVKKLFATIGHPDYEDGTLVAEDLVARRLTIVTKENKILLDADSLNFDFTVLDSIIYDDIIMSPEKAVLKNQFDVITSQKNNIITQAKKYISEVYADRDTTHFGTNGYFGLGEVKDKISTHITEIENTYSALSVQMVKVFANMNEKTVISKDLGMSKEAFHELFKNFHTAYEGMRNLLEDFLEKSSIQLGREYNKTVIDPMDGITVTRENMMTRTRLNATKGISIARNDGSYLSPSWTDVFYVTTEGNLYAVDITTKGLKIVDGNLGERITFDWNDGITIRGNKSTIYLNGNDGIKISAGGMDKFYVGTDGRLYAVDITTHGLKIVNGEIGESIIFDQTTGITINGSAGQQIRLNANEGIAIDVKSDPRFWIGTDGSLYAKKLIVMDDLAEPIKVDGSFISDLTVNKLLTLNSNAPQDVVHIEDNYIKLQTQYTGEGADATKFKLHFNGTGTAAYPEMIWGAESGGEVGKVYKDNNKFAFEYAPPNFQSKFWMNQTDSDGEGQAMLMKTTGGIRLDAQTRAVMTTGANEYVRSVKGEDVAMKFGEATVIIKNDELLIKFNASNYIKLSSSGVEVKGTKIDLN